MTHTHTHTHTESTLDTDTDGTAAVVDDCCAHESAEHHDHAEHAEHGDHAESAESAARRGPVSRAFLGAINLYRMTAPVRTPRCRYLPTCSEYAAEAIELHGPGRGLWLAARRLGRCHPFGSFGFDPVPEK